ncbi:Putative membrane protein [Zobellia galactanivorans]|uniref:Putative membrane protein n=1 Tax=Zobellia galactanivorans (strain DSM 12802 / CCUG 47099 / CIP 106680 / NCIMB 13871 / Dsij) TaxID=63186 RepID=G0L2B2_ZOBGA|nr:Putative membrane protein [Zobellia galactanivorans]
MAMPTRMTHISILTNMLFFLGMTQIIQNPS